MWNLIIHNHLCDLSMVRLRTVDEILATAQSADHVPNFRLRVSDISLVVLDHLHG